MNTKALPDSNLKNACLVCGEENTNLKRGLCQRHYEQFRRKRDALTQEAAEAWELRLIEDGKLLAKQQGKKFGTDDPFADSFNEFVSNNPGSVKEEAKTAKNLVKKAIEKTTEHRKKSNPKP